MKPCLLFLSIGIAGIFTACNKKEKKPADSDPSATSKDCIEKIMSIDDSLGKIRNHNCENISLSETIDAYVQAIGSVSTDDCPGSFTVAFADHLKAWINVKTITDLYPDLRGEMHDLFRQLGAGKDSTDFKKLQKNIWDTWAGVEKAMKE